MEIIQQEQGKVLSIAKLTIPVHAELIANPGQPSMVDEANKLTREQRAAIVQAEGFAYHELVDEGRLNTLVTSIFQNAWYIARAGEVPKGIMDGHKARSEKYEKALVTAQNAKPKEPKAPKSPKAPKPPKVKEPKDVLGRTRTTTSTVRLAAGQVYELNGVEPSADWLNGNVFRKGVYEILFESTGPLTLEQAMPLFLIKCKDTFRGTDGGKNQTKFRLKELVEAGFAVASTPGAPKSEAEVPAPEATPAI